MRTKIIFQRYYKHTVETWEFGNEEPPLVPRLGDCLSFEDLGKVEIRPVEAVIYIREVGPGITTIVCNLGDNILR